VDLAQCILTEPMSTFPSSTVAEKDVSKFNGSWKSWNPTSTVTQSPAGHSILYCAPSHCFGVLGQLILASRPTYSLWFGVLHTAWYVSYFYWFGMDLCPQVINLKWCGHSYWFGVPMLCPPVWWGSFHWFAVSPVWCTAPHLKFDCALLFAAMERFCDSRAHSTPWWDSQCQ